LKVWPYNFSTTRADVIINFIRHEDNQYKTQKTANIKSVSNITVSTLGNVQGLYNYTIGAYLSKWIIKN